MTPKETINFIFQSNVAGIKKASGAVKKLNARIKATKKASNTSFNAMNKGMIESGTIAEKLGNKFGFIAFQWTFIAGTASRALGEIRMAAQEVFREGAEGMSKIQKASLEAFELGDSIDETNRKMKIFSQYAQEMGSGATIFSSGEVADTLREVVKATNDINAAIPITNSLLKLMTIEEVDAAKGAKGFLAVMNNFKLTGEDVNRVTNTLVAVNKQSRLSLDEVIHSYEFAGQQARLMGLDIEEAGTLIGMIGDQLPAGTVGRTFSQMLVNFRKETVALNPVLQKMGVNLYDNTGNMREFDEIMRDMSKMMKSAGEKSDYFRDSILRSMKLDTRAERVFLALINNFEEYEDRLEKVRRGGEYVDFLYEQLKNTPEAAMKRLQHTFGQLKIQLVAGFAPALLQILEVLMEFVRREEIQKAFHAIGKAIGQNVIPLVEGAVWAFRGLVALYKKVGLGTDGLAKIVLGLSVALGTLVVVGTLITLFAMFASLAEKAAAKMAVLGITTRFTNMTMSSFLIGMMRVGAIMFGLWFLISGINRLWTTLSDGFQEGEEGAVLMGVGLTALGAAMVAVPLLPYVTKMGAFIAANVAGSASMIKFGMVVRGVGVAMLASGGIIGILALAAAAMVALGYAIAQVWKDFANVKPGDDWATLWQKTFHAIAEASATDWQTAFEAKWKEGMDFGKLIMDELNEKMASIKALFALMADWGEASFRGEWDLVFDIGKQIHDSVVASQLQFQMSGKLMAAQIAEGIANFDLIGAIWDSVMGIETDYMKQYEEGQQMIQGYNKEVHPWITKLDETMEATDASLDDYKNQVDIITGTVEASDFTGKTGELLIAAEEVVSTTAELNSNTSAVMQAAYAEIEESATGMGLVPGVVEDLTRGAESVVESTTELADAVTPTTEELKLQEEVLKETTKELKAEVAALDKKVKAQILETAITETIIAHKEDLDKIMKLQEKVVVSIIGKDVQLIRDKERLHALYEWYLFALETRLVPATIDSVEQIMLFNDRVIEADNAFARLAYAADKTVERLASVKISKDGSFSMAGFGPLPKGMNTHMPQATPIAGNAQDIANQLRALAPSAPTVNNNIEMTLDIESIRSEEDIERMAGLVADKIAEELDTKSLTE